MNEPGFVYVMEAAGLYKIGFSVSPRKRLSTVQGGSPVPVTLVGVIEGTKEDEAAWHHEFRAKRSHREWFALDDVDVARVLVESYGTAYLDS